MSTRQNKKRKGRNNVNNRERTVTTLTEDPNTPYLVPTPTEDPPGANLMSSPFSVASSSAPNQSPVFQSFGFGYNNVNYIPPMHSSIHHHNQQQQQQQPQQFFQRQPSLPPGQSDLEVLETLKKMIKDGQHEFYRAVPQPAALASIYLGPAISHHPEQPPSDDQPSSRPQSSYDPQSQVNIASTNSASSMAISGTDSSRRPPRIQAKDSRDGSGPKKPVAGTPSVSASSPIPNNVLSASSPDRSLATADQLQFSQSNQPSLSQAPASHPNGNNSAKNNDLSSTLPKVDDGLRRASLDSKPPVTPTASEIPSTAQRSFRFDQMADGGAIARSHSLDDDQQRAAVGRVGTGEATYGTGDLPPSKEMASSHQGTGWPHRDGSISLDDRRVRHDTFRRPPDGRSAVTDMASRGPGLRYPSYGDRERDRDRERERDRDRDRDRDWDFRDRRFDYRFRDDRSRLDNRRPPPEQRHYEPRYAPGPPIPRRYDSKSADEVHPADRRLDPTRPIVPPPSVDNRQAHPPVEDRPPPARAPLPETHGGRVPAVDDHHSSIEDKAIRPPQPLDPEVAGGTTSVEDRGVGLRDGPPPSSVLDDRRSRPLEDRISRPPPSLQDRLSQPPPPTSAKSEDNRLSHEPSLEERLSHAPTGAATSHSRLDDRLARPSHPIPPGGPDRAPRVGPVSDERSRLTDPARVPAAQDVRERPVVQSDERSTRTEPGERDRYVRPATPVQDRNLPRSSGYDLQTQRSASITRDETRTVAAKTPPSPPALPHDYRVVRDVSRERYRPNPYTDERRASDLMDVDGPPRFADNRVPYTRRFSPPSAADRARDRSRSFYPPPPPTPPHRGVADGPPYDIDSDRRYPGDRRDWYSHSHSQPYGDRRREWSDEDLYWKAQQRRTWDKERFEREIPSGLPPSSLPGSRTGWETREERERRTGFAGGLSPSARSAFEGPPPPPSQRPLSSRLTDGYPTSGSGSGLDDRPYVSERSRFPSRDNTEPAFTSSRVRQRSPSPVGRRPGVPVGSGGNDDIRPPIKRVREDAGYPPEYYSPPPPPPLSATISRDRDSGRRSSMSGEYPSRVATPPPSSGSSYYESRGGPPPPPSGSSSSAPSGSGGGDRDYGGPRERGAGLDYGPGPGTFERARSPLPPSRLPPPAYGRGGYGRGGDIRDDRRYNMPPPPSRSG